MKKFICFICIIATLFSITVSASPVLTEKAMKDLYEYGIMTGNENGDLRLEENVSRAEFSKMICAALGFKNTKTAQLFVVEDFLDVNENHWAYGYIQIARGLALIEGIGKGYFNPDGNIKIQDAVKITVAALGYETKTKKTSYPEGYLSIAEEIGLTKKDEFPPEKYATRKEVAYLISNALDIPLNKQTAFGSIIKYEIMDGKDGRALITLRTNLTPEEEKSRNNNIKNAL